MRRLLTASVLAVVVVLAGSAAPAQSTPPYVFLQLSDPQFGMFTQDREFAQETANFEFAAANVNRLKPDFVVITGDLVNKPGDTAQIAEYDRIRKIIDPAIPVYEMPGNHDVENAPTPESLAAYKARYQRDRYVFRHKNLLGIVLNSTLIHTPEKAPVALAEQDQWVRAELAKAKTSGARHIVIFQHHPWFIESADEPDDYFNLPLVRRTPLLALFRDAGVRTLISGHFHRNAVANDSGFHAVVTGAVGMPLGGSQSGFRAFRVTDNEISHRYFTFGEIPAAIDPSKAF